MDPSFQYLLNRIWKPSSVYLHLVQDVDVMKPLSTLFRIEYGGRFFENTPAVPEPYFIYVVPWSMNYAYIFYEKRNKNFDIP